MLVKSYLAVVAAIVLAVSSVSQGAPPLNDSPSPIVVAHRGLILDAPENTLASFKACLELGFGFELDVQRTRDGHLMCLHDTTLDRTTDGKGLLASLTRYQTVGLDAGEWFSRRFRNERLPGIDQVFALIASYPKSNAIYAVDIKLKDKQVEADLVQLAKKYEVLDRLLFIGNTIQEEGVRERLWEADKSVQMAAVAHDSKELLVSLAHPQTNWVYEVLAVRRGNSESAQTGEENIHRGQDGSRSRIGKLAALYPARNRCHTDRLRNRIRS